MNTNKTAEQPMQKLEANSPQAQSADLVAANIAQLKALFPELITSLKGAPNRMSCMSLCSNWASTCAPASSTSLCLANKSTPWVAAS